MNSLVNAASAAPKNRPFGDDRVTLDLQVQAMEAVLDIVTTLGRVGAEIVAIRAIGNNVRVTFDARNLVAKRLPSLLETIIGVKTVCVADDAELCEQAAANELVD
jgi:DNA-binding protein